MSGHVKVERQDGVARLEYEGPITVFEQEGGHAVPGIALGEEEAEVGFFLQSALAPIRDDRGRDLGTQVAGLLVHEGNCFREVVGAHHVRIVVEVVEHEPCEG